VVQSRKKRNKNAMPESASVAAIALKGVEEYYPPVRTGLRALVQPFEPATRPALKSISFEVQQGEAVALLGYVLLLDEPTRSLDAVAAAEYRQFLSSEVLRDAQTSVLFASHTLSEVELLATMSRSSARVSSWRSTPFQRCWYKTRTSTLEHAFFRLTGSATLFGNPGEHS